MFENYEELNEINLPTYIASLALTTASKKITNIEIISGGNVNNVFRIYTRSGQSFILKQALPYLKCMGKDHLLDKKRIAFESAYYQQIQILSKHPATPKIYYSDTKTMMVIIMEDLKLFCAIRELMLNSTDNQNIVIHPARFLANTLFYTSRFYLNLEAFEALMANFNGNTLRNPSELFLLKAPYINHESNHIEDQVFSETFKLGIMQLDNAFKTHTEALVHGDLHTGSFLTTTKDTRIIDTEFAYIGPMAFDTGTFLGNLILSWASHTVNDRDPYYANWICDAIKLYWETFQTTFLTLWNQHPQPETNRLLGEAHTRFQQHTMQTLLQQTAGFAGVEVCRRTIGVTGVEDIRGLDNDKQQRAEAICIAIGKKLIEQHQTILTTENIIGIMQSTLPAKGFSHNKETLFQPGNHKPLTNDEPAANKPTTRSKL